MPSHEIRTAYLDKLSEGETRNLMRLCVLAELEVPLPQQALCDLRARFEVAGKRMGLVFVETVEKWNIGFRYRLAHAALGELILFRLPSAPSTRHSNAMPLLSTISAVVSR